MSSFFDLGKVPQPLQGISQFVSHLYECGGGGQGGSSDVYGMPKEKQNWISQKLQVSSSL